MLIRLHLLNKYIVTFTIDELGIDESVDAGETVAFTYTFDRPGTFRLICIPHEALGMTGELVVE